MANDREKPSGGIIAEAINDIRQTVVEEGWFGRPTTSDIPNFYESMWARYGHPAELPSTLQEQQPSQHPDIER